MEGMKYGYARVSTDDQTPALQLAALKKAGCKTVFKDDGLSGATTKRPALLRCLKKLEHGDTLILWKLDRLARISHRTGFLWEGGEVQVTESRRDRRLSGGGGRKTACNATQRRIPTSVRILCSLRQASYSGSREALHPGQHGLEFAVLFGGGLIERGGLRAELHVDRLALDFVGPFEVRAVTPGRIAVAGALRLAVLHHALQDGPLQEIVQLLEFLPDLMEA